MELGAIGSCPTTKWWCSELSPGDMTLKPVCVLNHQALSITQVRYQLLEYRHSLGFSPNKLELYRGRDSTFPSSNPSTFADACYILNKQVLSLSHQPWKTDVSFQQGH